MASELPPNVIRLIGQKCDPENAAKLSTTSSYYDKTLAGENYQFKAMNIFNNIDSFEIPNKISELNNYVFGEEDDFVPLGTFVIEHTRRVIDYMHKVNNGNLREFVRPQSSKSVTFAHWDKPGARFNHVRISAIKDEGDAKTGRIILDLRFNVKIDNVPAFAIVTIEFNSLCQFNSYINVQQSPNNMEKGAVLLYVGNVCLKSEGGGAVKDYVTIKGKKRLVRTGKRGGKFVLIKGERKYI